MTSCLKKPIVWIPIFVALASFYLNQEKVVGHTVKISVPVEETWSFVSDSTMADKWSVYFSHISPVENGVKDGEIGSVRRCFRDKNEKGVYWDEVVTQKTANAHRHLVTYNTHGYGILDLYNKYAEFDVDQVYTVLDSNSSTLSFRTKGRNFLGRATIMLTHGEVHSVFVRNLENIRIYLESGIAMKNPYDTKMW